MIPLLIVLQLRWCFIPNDHSFGDAFKLPYFAAKKWASEVRLLRQKWPDSLCGRRARRGEPAVGNPLYGSRQPVVLGHLLWAAASFAAARSGALPVTNLQLARVAPGPPDTGDEGDKWKQTIRLHSTGNARCRNVRLDVGTQQNGTAREKKDELSCGEMLCRRVGNAGQKVQRGAGKRDCLRRRKVRGVQAAAARSRAPRRGLAGRGGARPCAAATVAAS
ncbi:uncharacterized protein LOC124616320 [Schistocerca americana]|uniref:uncharacterized protein LOC124616320 n=1 Tax=Schistocerca americana TaxID=7009 RepID=UPI001F4F2C8F|nr:uncharacterized protein LOC124616320 [Schistocerca americana]